MITLTTNNDIDNILKSLADFEIKLQNKAIRSGLTAVAAPIKKAMRQNAPKKTGRLAASITQKLLNKSQKASLSITNTDVALVVGPNKQTPTFTNVSWRAIFIEEGVRAHEINTKVTRKLRRSLKLKIGGRVLTGGVKHPGLKANPFMARSIEQNKSSIEPRFYQGMAKMLDKIRVQ